MYLQISLFSAMMIKTNFSTRKFASETEYFSRSIDSGNIVFRRDFEDASDT